MTGNADIRSYEKKMTGDELERVEACNELGVIATEAAARLLIRGLYDTSPYVRNAAASWLATIADERIVGYLIDLLREENVAVRNQAGAILAKVGRGNIDLLAAQLDSSDTDVRILTATVLGETGEHAAAVPLNAALIDENINVRYAAAESLGSVGDSASISLLINIVKTDPYVAFAAVESLGELSSIASVPLLIGIVEKDEWLRYPAIESLGSIGDPRGVSAVMAQLDNENTLIQRTAVIALAKIESKNNLSLLPQLRQDLVEPMVEALWDSDEQSRRAAATALGWIGTLAQAPLLIRLLGDTDDETQGAALAAIGRLAATDPSGYMRLLENRDLTNRPTLIGNLRGCIRPDNREDINNFLVGLLKDPDKEIRTAALACLADVGNHLSIADIINALYDPVGNVRVKAAEALGRLKVTGAAEQLLVMMGDAYADVRAAVATALGRIGTEEIISGLINRLDSDNAQVRETAIYALGQTEQINGDNLAVAFSNPDPKVRRVAVGILVKRRIPLLSARLKVAMLDEDWQVRKLAAQAMGQAGAADMVEILIGGLADENMWVSYAAAQSLGRFNKLPARERQRVADSLVQALNTENDIVKIAAIKTLAGFADQDVVPPILALSEDKNEDIRQAVAEAIGAFSDERVGAVLEALGSDIDPGVRAAAGRAMVERENELAGYRARKAV